MTPSELLEHFVSKNNEFIKAITDPDRFNNPYLIEQKEMLFREDLTHLYSHNVLFHLNDIYFRQKNKLEEDLGFFPDQGGKKVFCNEELIKLKNEYATHEYNYLFTKDNFQNEFFDIHTIETLIFNLMSIHENIYDIYEEKPEVFKNLSELERILNIEFFEMIDIAEILIRVKLIHIQLDNYKVEYTAPKPDIEKKEKNFLTLNQKVELVNKLILINNWEALSQIRQAEIINLLTDLNEDNIKKSIRKIGEKVSKKSAKGQKDYDLIQKLTEDFA